MPNRIPALMPTNSSADVANRYFMNDEFINKYLHEYLQGVYFFCTEEEPA